MLLTSHKLLYCIIKDCSDKSWGVESGNTCTVATQFHVCLGEHDLSGGRGSVRVWTQHELAQSDKLVLTSYIVSPATPRSPHKYSDIKQRGTLIPAQ